MKKAAILKIKHGGYAVLITLALTAGLILFNLIMGRLGLQIDMTKDKLFSLSAQSVRVAQQIKSPVEIYGLWEPGRENPDVTEVIDLYIAHNKNIRYRTVDPDKNPGFLTQFDAANQGIEKGGVIVEGSKGFRIISPYQMYDLSSYYNQTTITGIAVEHRITNALIYVETGETPVIYEVMGHGENALASLSLSDMVQRENFSLKQLNLIQSGVPDNASALIINAPKTDFSRPEADKVLDYLEQGGRLFVLADYRIQGLSVINEMLASYGIRFDYGIVVENNSTYLLGNAYLAITDMNDHAITKPLQDKKTFVVMPYGMGVSKTETRRRSVVIEPLLSSSSNSWLRGDVTAVSSSMLPTDKAGPITTAVAVTDPQEARPGEQQARIVAVGSGAILQPIASFGVIPANLDFFMNSLTWLEDRPETISVRSKNVFLLPLRMSGLQIGIFAGIFVVVIPLAFFVCGFVVWLKRRHL